MLTFPRLVPEKTLRDHHCFIASDTRFRSAARLLAALWREAEDLPVGVHVDPAQPKPKKIKLGSRIAPAAAHAGRTFVDPSITAYARQALLFREPGSVWNEERLWANLLSSQALTLNLLAPMAIDLQLATRVWQRLLPSFVHQVTGLRFEHSPGRFGAHWFGDGTAYDAIIDLVTPEGEPAFVTIEMKYVEDMLAAAATPRPRYDETTQECGLFVDPDSPTLRRPGFEQLRREHVMSQLMVEQGLASRGLFILIGPRLNRRVDAAARLYAAELVDPSGASLHHDGRTRVGFDAITLEAVIEATAEAGAVELARKLWARYCDFDRVVCVALQGSSPPPASPSSPAVAPSTRPEVQSKPRSPKPRRPRIARLTSARRPPTAPSAEAAESV